MDLIYGCRMPGNNDSRLLLYKTDPMAGLAIRSCASLSALGTTGFGGMGLLSELSYVWERRNPAPEDDPRKKYFAHNWAWETIFYRPRDGPGEIWLGEEEA